MWPGTRRVLVMAAPRSDPYPHVSFVESYAPDGWVIVKLGGQLDAESRPSIESKLHLLAESADATIDLSRTTSIDLGSVRMLVACQERARLHRHSLRIENPPPYVERMLEMLQRGHDWRPGETLGARGEGDSYEVPPPTTPDAQRSQPESVQ